MGLTGFITWAQIKLQKIESSIISQEQIKFRSLSEFLQLSEESEKTFPYTASWVDCVTSGSEIRGIFIRGQFSSETRGHLPTHAASYKKTIPIYFPNWTLNKFSVSAFNLMYFHKNLSDNKSSHTSYDQFFYPLDSVLHWNRIYGRRGFLQYQFVVPYKNDGGKTLSLLFKKLKDTGLGSFLVVLKTFGPIPSLGMMSFPVEGITLALDFPIVKGDLFRVLEECDRIVADAGGKVYAAKDSRMSKQSFEKFYPRLGEFARFIDPRFSSSFWRRVT